MFKESGYQIDCVHDGTMALEMLERQRYSAVLLDLMMPEVNGVDIVRHLARTAPHEMKRIIVVTAADPRMIDPAHQSLLAGVVTKPFDVEAMRELVHRVIGRADASADRADEDGAA